MRGLDERSGSLFSYVDLEARVRADHPLRPIRAIVIRRSTASARSSIRSTSCPLWDPRAYRAYSFSRSDGCPVTVSGPFSRSAALHPFAGSSSPGFAYLHQVWIASSLGTGGAFHRVHL